MAAGSTYTPIATTTLSGTATSLDFTSISGSYTDLILVIVGKSNTTDQYFCRFNSDTGTNYSDTRLGGNGTSAASDRHSGVTQITLSWRGYPTNTAGESVGIFQFMNYSNSTTYKTVLSRTNTASLGVDAVVGLWRSTAAITTISVTVGAANGWQSGTTATLYGITAA